MDLISMLDESTLLKYWKHITANAILTERRLYKYNPMKLSNILWRYKEKRNSPDWLDNWAYSTNDMIDYLYTIYRKYWAYLEKGEWFEKALNSHYIYIDWIRDEDNDLIPFPWDTGKKKKPWNIFNRLKYVEDTITI